MYSSHVDLRSAELDTGGSLINMDTGFFITWLHNPEASTIK